MIESVFVEKAASVGFGVLVKRLFEGLSTSVDKKGGGILGESSVDIEPHLSANFDRCSKVKTILNKSEPANLLSLYVNIAFKNNNQIIDDYDLISSLSDKRHIIISGTGGGGKTIFMKYLWISLFVNPKGRIPVFIELRKLNEFNSDDLVSYIYRSIIDVKSSISREQFLKCVNDGQFVFILDGYDEVTKEKKDSLQSQILKLSYDNPKAVIVVSGRPDDKFDSWQSFTVFNVLPFKREQVIQLVEKLDYDKKIKTKFISRIKSDLFAKHPSFLSNPLLATMMLLTYDQFAEIPEKAYIFYEQAFDTLFLKHDATKEGFTRQKYTDLSIDEFKKYLSYFCLFSYYDEKYEFTEAETIEYIGKAIQATNTKLNKSDFYRDLIESVCIMQQDGLKTVFTHRTFQEFFCTYSLANFVDNKIEHILSHIVRRRSDNVIPMLFEMRRGKVEREFIIPKLTEIVKLGQEQNCGESLFTHAKLFNWYLGVRRPAKSAYSFVQYDEQGNGDIVNLLFKLYKDIGSPIKKNFPKYKKDDANILKELAAQKRLKLKIDEITIVFPDPAHAEHEVKIALPQMYQPLSEEEILNTGYWQYCRDSFAFVQKALGIATARVKKEAKSLENILGIK